ncbi:cation transporter [bacterium]|nr:cation transporter [bacterium]
MDSCCQKKTDDLEKISKSQSKVLWIVLSINITMFFVEMISGYFSNSLSLMGDSLDMLGDSIAYGSSLYVINMGLSAKVKAASLKGVIMLITAALVLGRALYQVINLNSPNIEMMSTVGIIALGANLICLLLLTKHRNEDINMSSVWICSRNDIIANLSVLASAYLVYLSSSAWPDIIVGIVLAALFTHSAIGILKGSKRATSVS